MFQRSLAALKSLVRPRPSQAVASRFRELTHAQSQQLHESLVQHYFARQPAEYLESPAGQVDLQNHLHTRLHHDRHVVIPWLESAVSLAGRTVLEVGCGTGCSTAALAEQGAEVTGIDLDEAAMEVARTRCAMHEVRVDFHLGNAVDVNQLLPERQFDLVIFYAALEHMTHEERILAIQRTWKMVAPGGFWCVIESPNRLWYFDHHTSLMPFYLWLPDDLAFAYSRFSSRDGFGDRFRQLDDAQMLAFLRQGRGVSYHEWEVALEKPAEHLSVVSSLATYHRTVNMLRRFKWPRSRETRFTALLREVHPQMPIEFLQPSLDIILQPHA